MPETGNCRGMFTSCFSFRPYCLPSECGFCSFIWNLSFHGTGQFTSGWRNNGRFQGIIPPCLPAAAALDDEDAFLYGVSLHAAGIAVNLVFGSLLPLVAWGILRQLTSCREIALGAAFLMAFHPSAIGLSADVTRDTLYLFTGGSAVLFALYGIRSGKWQGWCFSALFLAFGLFVRYEILELVPLTVACFLIAPAVRSISLKTALANFAVWGGTFLISALAIALLTGVLPQTAAAYNERIQRISIQKI